MREVWGSLDGSAEGPVAPAELFLVLGSKGRRSGELTGSWKEGVLEGGLPQEELWLLSGITAGPRAPRNEEARKRGPWPHPPLHVHPGLPIA